MEISAHGVDALFDIEIKDSHGGGVDATILQIPRRISAITVCRSATPRCRPSTKPTPTSWRCTPLLPNFGWEHKELHENCLQTFLGSIAATVGAPDLGQGSGHTHRHSRLQPEAIREILKSLKEGTELIIELYDKMAVRPIKVDATPPKRFSGLATRPAAAGPERVPRIRW